MFQCSHTRGLVLGAGSRELSKAFLDDECTEEGALSVSTRYAHAVRFLIAFLILISGAVRAADVGVPAVTAPSAAAAAVPRVFFAPLTAGAAADPAVVTIIDERLLTSARRHRQFDIVASRDLRSMLDLEAVRQESGCDDSGVDCAAELAGAFDAPQLVTGQLGRVGNTWILSMTRMERATMQVLARVSRESRGDTPEGLLSDLDSAIDELFQTPSTSAPPSTAAWLVPVGGVTAGVGVVGLAVGGVATWLSWNEYSTAEQKLRGGGLDAAERASVVDAASRTGGLLNGVAIAGFVAGGALVVVGVGALAVGALQGAE